MICAITKLLDKVERTTRRANRLAKKGERLTPDHQPFALQLQSTHNRRAMAALLPR